MTTGEKIKALRIAAGMTQDQLGEKCHKQLKNGRDSTIAGSTIRRYESGKLNPKPETLKIIAEALGVHWNELTEDEPALDAVQADFFRNRARKVLEVYNPYDVWEHFPPGDRINGIIDGSIAPTQSDVFSFSAETGISFEYLIGIADDLDYHGSKLWIPGYTEIDIGLCIMHIKKFIENDLKLGKCTIEDAEAVTTLVLERIQAKNLIPIAKRVNRLPWESWESALNISIEVIDLASKNEIPAPSKAESGTEDA